MIAYTLPTQFSPAKSEPDTEPQDSDTLPLLQNLSLPKLKQPNTLKIKSSLCKNFMMAGFCPYGSRCQFAHGPQELRCNQVENTSYKTKTCFSFVNKGYCSYGHRCNFIHRENTKETGMLLVRRIQNFPEILTELGGQISKLIGKVILPISQ